jgi:hypothetical protein
MKTGRKTAYFILSVFIISLCGFLSAVAEITLPQPSPERYRVEATSVDEPDIGYNSFDGYYVDFAWDEVESHPDLTEPHNKFINVYLQEFTPPYKPNPGTIIKDPNLSGALTSYRMKNLDSGTIYYSYLRAYYTYEEEGTTFSSVESNPSNNVKFMTDISITGNTYAANQLLIEWDDVWDAGKRIDYKLYISENENFANTPAIYLSSADISQNGIFTVNEGTGKLRYIHTVNDPGRVFYIKLVPDIIETNISYTAQTETIILSSYILVRTSKLSTNEFGTIWRLDWSPVVTGLSTTGINTSYQIYSGVVGTNDVPQYVAAVDDTNFLVTQGPDDPEKYYIIRASITKDGEDVYPGIRIESDRVTITEAEVPAIPTTPFIVDEFRNDSNDIIISFEEELTANSATLLWKVPKKSNGEVDTNVLYDIWLIDDPDYLDNTPDSMKIAASFEMTEENYVRDGSNLIGYKYVVDNLTSNNTYYLKIVAKKTYLDYVEEVLQTVIYESYPALKAVNTPSDGLIDKPLVPSKPPLRIKTHEGTTYLMVDDRSAVIQLKNEWFEIYDDDQNDWLYWIPDLDNPLEKGVVDRLEDGTATDADNLRYRMITYDEGVTIDVGAVIYTDGITSEEIAQLATNRIIGFPTFPNDPYEDASQNHDEEKHNIDITLSNLIPNTTYIVWIRAARRSAGEISDPSETLIITTNPELTPPVEKPVVPQINYHAAGDTYVDLAWDFVPQYTYNLKYGTVDDIDSVSNTIRVEPDELLFKSFYTVSGLTENTEYYFFLQAETENSEGIISLSEWSDSYIVRTKDILPPSQPRGFGIKNTDDAVTKNSLTYEWAQEDGVVYILEISDNAEFNNPDEYNIDDASEYTVSELRSNYRYYARLFAYNEEKDLRSSPTLVVTYRTLRSNDEYDSDKDIESIEFGPFIDIDNNLDNGQWNISIIDANADRFTEHIINDSYLDYKINIDNYPGRAESVRILLSNKILNTFTRLGENLIIESSDFDYLFRPKTLSIRPDGDMNFNYEITVAIKPHEENSIETNTTPLTDIKSIDVSYIVRGNSKPYDTLGSDLKIIFKSNDMSWYEEDITNGFVYNKLINSWEEKDTSLKYLPDLNLGLISFKTGHPGKFFIGKKGDETYDDTRYHYGSSSITNISNHYNLKSIKTDSFNPDDDLLVKDAVKILFDILDIDYGYDYLNQAVKSGIIGYNESINASSNCSRELMISMVMRLYELKTGIRANLDELYYDPFTDTDDITEKYKERLYFAIDRGLYTSRFSNILGPQDNVPRVELMTLLEKVLTYIGEL